MGNCKSCLKPRTSDDIERPSSQSISVQGPSSAQGDLICVAESSAAGRVPSAVSRRSKSAKSVSAPNQPLHPRQNQEVPPSFSEDGTEADRRISSATRQRIHDSGLAHKKENVIFVRPAESSDAYTNEAGNLMNKLKTQYPINSVKDICFILWQKDERLVHNKDYKVRLPIALWHQSCD